MLNEAQVQALADRLIGGWVTDMNSLLRQGATLSACLDAADAAALYRGHGVATCLIVVDPEGQEESLKAVWAKYKEMYALQMADILMATAGLQKEPQKDSDAGEGETNEPESV